MTQHMIPIDHGNAVGASLSLGPTFIKADEVVPLINMKSTVVFLRRREELEEKFDFPLPLPTCQRPLQWRRSEIIAWAARQGLPACTPPNAVAIANERLLHKAHRA